MIKSKKAKTKPGKVRKKSEIQIFLAHAKEDEEEVLKLYYRLKQAGYKPWLDKKDLIAGQKWREVISQAITNSELFIACFSSCSVAKQGYVQREYKMALTNAAERPNNSIYIIPLRLDECQIPNLRHEECGLNLKDFHRIDYWEADGFDQLKKAIVYQYGSSEKTEKLTLEVELKSERGVDYTRLRDLLAAGEWKEADEETTTVMLRAAGRESQGWLDVEDIAYFPCEDLRTINQLWLHYSDGKFGFSVQKEIYESLGGTRDKWEKFGDRVGWIKGGNWLFYSDLTFDIKAPHAHLPGVLRRK